MRRIAVSALLAAAVLLPASQATAKELTTLAVCGADGCAGRTDRLGGADRGHGGLLDLGLRVDAPAPEPFVRLRLGIGDGREVFGRDDMAFLPGQGLVQAADGGWYALPERSVRFFRAMARGVARVPAAQLELAAAGRPPPQARVVETFPPGARDDAGGTLAVLLAVLAALAMAGVTAGAVVVRRHRDARHDAAEERPATG
jgi:hypothetical protein